MKQGFCMSLLIDDFKDKETEADDHGCDEVSF